MEILNYRSPPNREPRAPLSLRSRTFCDSILELPPVSHGRSSWDSL